MAVHSRKRLDTSEEGRAMRTYGEVISIRSGSSGSGSLGAGPAGGVAVGNQFLGGVAVGNQFLWRSRIYVVRAVLAHWVESGTWWTSLHRSMKSPVVPGRHVDQAVDERSITRDVGATERWVWRVEAAAGSSAPIGVYDVACDVHRADVAELVHGQWRLARALD